MHNMSMPYCLLVDIKIYIYIILNWTSYHLLKVNNNYYQECKYNIWNEMAKILLF